MKFPDLNRPERGRKRPPVLVITGLLVTAVLALALLRVGTEPTLKIEPTLPGIGPSTPVEAVARVGGRGLGSVRLELVQGEQVTLLAESQHQPRPFWAFWGPRETEAILRTTVGKSTHDALEPGQATLRLVAERAGTWLRHPDATVLEKVLPVKLVPPTVEVVTRPVRIHQGGTAVVVYRIGDDAVRDGVAVGELWFPGFPLPGQAAPGGDGSKERFAFFAAPHDLDDGAALRLVAYDVLGNQASFPVVDEYRPRVLTTDTIDLSDGFMERVVPAIRAQTPGLEDHGDLLENYLAINRDLRRTNAGELVALATESRPEMLWRGTFLQLPSSRAMAPFADRRTYRYQGRDVDQQDHLGFDLASVRRAPVPAANHGVVALARFFGIYGNTVVIDHGYGLMSLYSHLSSITAAEGDRIDKGQEIGRTGQTGLAGGDHLHFSMLVQGTRVDPLEWWDRRWIESRIETPLADAFIFD